MYSTNCTIHRNNRGKPPKPRGKKPRGSNTTLAKCGFFDPGPNCTEINPKKKHRWLLLDPHEIRGKISPPPSNPTDVWS
jgi:hypothetical protein